MKKLLLPIFLILGVSMFIGFVSAQCTDSDGGKDALLFGTTQGPNNGNAVDFCINYANLGVLDYETLKANGGNTGVIEHYCDDYGNVANEGIKCSNGCSNGACTPISCSDSDNGKDYFVKGSTRVIDTEIDDTDDDTCVSSSSLAEQSCESGQQRTTIYNCPNGCSDGACVKKVQTCNETDGGNNAYKKGKMVAYIISSSSGNLEKVEATDSCVGDGTVENAAVIEYYCASDGMGGQNYNSISVRCPNGCGDGACLGEPSDTTPQTNKCSETDSGIDLYTKGSISGPWLGDITGPISTQEDVCVGNTLQEFTCEQTSVGSNVYGIVQKGMDCSRGCKNGACVPISCSDSDEGEKFYIKGSTRVVAEGIDDTDDDTCVSNNVLAEQSCVEGQQKTILYECTSGCENGACIKTELNPKEDDSPLEAPKDNIITKDNISSEPTKKEVFGEFICNGCGLENKCYPFGFRKDGNFCSDKNSKFISQNKPDSSCENSFECDSNLCIDNKCVSGSLWAKIMRWFSNLFGGN